MKKRKLLQPSMPNVVEDTYGDVFDISKLTREEAEQYADMMREAFMKHWEERKKRKEAVKAATGEGY